MLREHEPASDRWFAIYQVAPDSVVRSPEAMAPDSVVRNPEVEPTLAVAPEQPQQVVVPN